MGNPSPLVDLSSLDATFIDLSDLPDDERTRQWHALRKTIIGASDVAGILGISPWSSPWSVWADKLGIMPNTESNVMKAGKYLERAIVPWYEDETGTKIIAEQFVAISKSNSRAGSTLDGIVVEDAAISSVFEMKTGSSQDWEIEIPIYYQTQAQWQMYVTGLEIARFALFDNRHKPLAMFELQRDQADIDFMLEEISKFLELVDSQTPPSSDSSAATIEAMKAYWPEQVEGKEVDITELQSVRDDLAKAKADIKEAEERERAAQSKLIKAIGDAEIATINGEQAFTFKSSSTTRAIAAEAIMAMYPRAGAKLLKTTPSRTLRACASKKGK